MAFPSFTWALWSVSLLTALLASTVPSNTEFDVNALQPMTSDETVSEGGAVTLTCRVAESDNSSLQWSNTAQQTLFFGAKRALRDNRIKLHRSTPTELSITISDVELGDEGEYTCSLFTMPVLTAVATVTVLGVPTKPQIVGYNDAVPEGGKVTLTCTTTGSKPPARLRWFRGDQELQGRPDVVEPEPDVPTFKVISELDLEVSRDDDNALITCAVEHPSIKLGEQQSEQPLRVLFTPVVDIQPESDLPREGERFYLQCMGNGNPSPLSYTWERKDGELPLLAKADGAYLMFELLNKSDNGVYLCQINNGIGKSQGAYTLQVQGLGDVDASPGVSPLSPSGSPAFEASAPSSPPSSVSSSPSSSPPSQSGTPPPPSADATAHPTTDAPTTPLSNALFPDRPLDPSASHPAPPASPASPASPSPSLSPPLPANATVSVRLNGLYTFTDATKNIPDPTAMSSSSGVDHAVIGGVVAVIVFILLCLLIVLGRYLIRHKGTYLTHEAKGSDDAPDADTAIINAEGGHSGAEDKKEYFI